MEPQQTPSTHASPKPVGRSDRTGPADCAAALRTTEAECPVCRRPAGQLPLHATGRDFEYDTTGETEWALRRCPECDVVVLSPRPAESELPRIYPSRYYAYDFTAKGGAGYRVKTLLDRRAVLGYLRHATAGGREAAPVLDVGCGDGRLLRLFRAAGVPPERLYGMELSDVAAAAARTQGFRVHTGRFEDIDYPASFFGLAVLQQVIEHVADPAAVVSKLRAVLRPGGVAILETPNVASWDHALFGRRHWGGYHIPRHFHLFTPRSLGLLLDRGGFDVVARESLASPSFWIQSVHHALKERGAPPMLLRAFHPHVPGPAVLALFTAMDLLGKGLGLTSNLRIVARKR